MLPSLAPVETDGIGDFEAWRLFERYLPDDSEQQLLDKRHHLSEVLQKWEADKVPIVSSIPLFVHTPNPACLLRTDCYVLEKKRIKRITDTDRHNLYRHSSVLAKCHKSITGPRKLPEGLEGFRLYLLRMTMCLSRG